MYFPDIFDDDKVLDGISIKSDYIGKVFHLLQQTEMRNDDILNNINKIIEGAIKTYALLDGLFQYFLIFSIYYFNLSIERATFY